MLSSELILKDIIGNKNKIEALLSALNKCSSSSSWIIRGPKGIGKAKLVFLITQYLLNIKPNNNKKNFTNLIHPDLFYLKKDIDEKKNIAVNRVRNILSFFSKTSYHTSGRIAVVDSISDLNTHGLNTLLKILEEPPSNSTIFLIDHQSNYIPSTIASRCKIFSMNSLNEKETKNILTNLTVSTKEEELNFLTDIAKGSPGLAIEYANHNAHRNYKAICNYFYTLEEKYGANILDAIKTFKDKKNKEALQIILNLFKYLFLKLINLKNNIEIYYFFEEEKAVLKKLNAKLNTKNIINIIDTIKIKMNNYETYSLNKENILLTILININTMLLNTKND